MTFEKNILSIYKDKGKNWLAHLPKKIRELSDLWELDHLQAFENLSFNYVLKGYQKNKPIVLKLSIDEPSLYNEAKALKAFSNQGAVALLQHTNDALLLQKAEPGTSLKTGFPKGSEKALEIACDMAKKIHQAPIPKDHIFHHINDWLAVLDKDWEIPQVHLKKARALKNQLLKAQTTSTLLHGDLHRDNILSNGSEWLIIDPKGVIGFPINEVWAFVEEPQKDLKFISEYFNFNFDDVVKWYYVHLILAACWQVEDRLDPKLFLDLADIANSM